MDFQTLPKQPLPEINFKNLSSIDYFGLNLVIPDEVYGPMEDTDLSIKFLGEWLNIFRKSSNYADFKSKKKTIRILEMGTGCGVLSLYLISRLIKEKITCYHNGIDINPIAIQTAEYNARMNKLHNNANFHTGDLFDPLSTNEQKLPYDFILFNPPYLASEPETINESNRKWIDLAWEGGINGNEITIRFLENISRYLSKNGEIFYISSSRVNQRPIEEKLSKLDLELVKRYEKKVFFEKIFLNHYSRMNP